MHSAGRSAAPPALGLLLLLLLAAAATATSLTGPSTPESNNSMLDLRRACAALHNEVCSEENPVPGPCTKAEKCEVAVCTPGEPGSCADDPTLSWCDSIDCSRVAHLVRQVSNVFGKLNDPANPVVVE